MSSDWVQAIRTVLSEWKDKEIRFGSADCCQLAGRYIELRTGEDYLARFDYDGRRSAEAIIDGHEGLVQVVRSCLGEPSLEELQPGGVAVFDTGEDCSVGIYNGQLMITVSVLHREVMRCLVQPEYIKAHWNL